jgi:thioredoxin-related protein
MRSLWRLVLFTAFLVPALAAGQSTGAARDPMQHFFMPTLGDLKAELDDAKRAGKRAAFVMYMRDDCPYCERMKKNILSRPAVQDAYRRQFAVLAVDTKGAVPISDFAGKPTTEKDFSLAQGVRYTPVIIFYGLDGKPLTRIDGEIRSVGEFMLLGEFVASGAYTKMNFAEFRQAAPGAKQR